ncbi:MAG: sensor histidine kinase [Dongiaceae bacterium]
MAIVGSIRRNAPLVAPGAQASRPRRSLASRIILLAAVFIAVPVALYQTFVEAEADRQALLIEAVQERGRLVGLALEPLLQTTDPSPLLAVDNELQRFASATTRLKVLFRPADQTDVSGFFFVAASPVVPAEDLTRARDELLRQGILGRVSASCTENLSLATRYQDPTGEDEILTSITPVLTPAGCWIVLVAHPYASMLGTSLAEPVWQRFEVQVAAAIYLAMAIITIIVFLSMRRSVLRFRGLARDIRTGHAGNRSFASQNELVELSGVAEEFDHLIAKLRASADSIRHAAEDNAHAMKTPIAIMRQSLEPLKRLVPSGEPRGRRAIEVIENSIERLDQLVSSARRMDEAMAELLDPPRQPVDVSRLLRRMIVAYGSVIEARGLRFATDLDDKIVVRASEELLETVVENIVDNSISVSPPGGRITLSLKRESGRAKLTIADEGPGVPSQDLERIFERRFSNRPTQEAKGAGSSLHAGIGLWIVRRNVEAVGGQVHAENGPNGGLMMQISLPLAV